MEVLFCSNDGIQGMVPLVLRLKEKVRYSLEGTRACEIFDIYCKLVEESYALKVLLVVILGSFVIPTFAFIAFAVLTFITTFAVFLLLEGAILLISAYAAVIWLGAVGIFFILSAIFTMVVYFIYKHAEDIACKIERYFFRRQSDSMDDDMVVIETDHED